MKAHIFISLIPLSMILFNLPKIRKGLELLSALIALGAIVGSSFNIDLSSAAPMVIFLLVYFVQKLRLRDFKIFELMGALMIAQALISKNFGEIIALIVISDLFFCASQDNVKKYIHLVFSWAPLVIGALLNQKADNLCAFTAATIILRSLNWPIKTVNERKPIELLDFMSKVVVPVILWRAQQPAMPQIWVGFWFAMPLFFGWGPSAKTALTLMSLSLWTISPQFGLFSLALWPLYFMRSWGLIFYGIVLAAAGALAFTQPLGLNDEAMYAIAAIEGLVTARLLTTLFLSEEKVNMKEFSANFLISGVVIGASFALFINPLEIQWTISGAVFGGTVFLFTLINYFLLRKKSRLFEPLRDFEIFEWVTEKFEKNSFKVKSSSPTRFTQFKAADLVFKVIESEAYVIFLAALVMCIFLWSVM